MSLFGFKEKKEIERLRSQMTPEQTQLHDLNNEIERASNELDKLIAQIGKEQEKLERIKRDIIETDEAALLQSFGFYTPHYSYRLSDDYKDKLKENRDRQKQLVKNQNAILANQTWTVNNSKSQGKKMVSDMQKLFLRAFNAECDDAIEHVKFNNVESCEKKIRSSCEAISKLGSIMSIRISDQYLRLKMEELYLVHEYNVKKQEEKEELKEARARMREEAKLAKEIEAQRKKLEKEQKHYQNALVAINKQLENASGDEVNAILEKKAEIESQLGIIDKEFRDVDYREANVRAGYVYVISNIGAFGKDIYKIGMTRRLEPMDRIDELGSASVPFDFDVHAMIFTEDAPGLETALHQAFSDRKVNFVNTRREFFNVTLDEIKTVIKANFDKSVEFVDIPPAEQYRESLLLKGLSVE